MSDELIHLNKEDQAYVKKMVAYIGAKSYFYDDEALGEQLYNMVCDLKVAEKKAFGRWIILERIHGRWWIKFFQTCLNAL